MALVLDDRIKESTTVTSTGPATLLGAATGFQAFSVLGNGSTTYYCISDQTGANWEVGLGTYSTTGPTLTRTTILSSSNSGSAVNFGAGTKDVFVTIPAGKGVWTDSSNNVTLPAALTITGNLSAGGGVAGTVLTSTVATGTAPFAVTSTTAVANLSIGGNAGTATSLTGGVTGAIPYQSNTGVTAMTAAGTTGQVLTTVTTGGAPTWQTPAGGGGAGETFNPFLLMGA